MHLNSSCHFVTLSLCTYSKIPTYASTTDGAQFLKLKREADSIFYDQRHQCREGSFENTATWLDGLESVIVMLGKKVYGPDGSAAFPAGGNVALLL
jgi:hypothetical protein